MDSMQEALKMSKRHRICKSMRRWIGVEGLRKEQKALESIYLNKPDSKVHKSNGSTKTNVFKANMNKPKLAL